MDFYDGWDEGHAWRKDVLDGINDNIGLLDENMGKFIQKMTPLLLDKGFSIGTNAMFYDYEAVRTFCKFLQNLFDLKDPYEIKSTLMDIIINDEGYFKWRNLDEFNKGEGEAAKGGLRSVERSAENLFNEIEGSTKGIHKAMEFQTTGNLGTLPCMGGASRGCASIDWIKKFHPDYCVGAWIGEWTMANSKSPLVKYAKTLNERHMAFYEPHINARHQFALSYKAPKKSCHISQTMVDNGSLVYVPVKYAADSASSGILSSRCYTWLPEEIVREYSLPIMETL